MKRVWWVARIAALVAASYCIFIPGGANVRADEGSCDTSANCARNSNSNCYCPNVNTDGTGCQGCFVPNNSTGCGSCSGGAC